MVSFILTIERLKHELCESQKKTKMFLLKNNEMCPVVQLRPDCVLITPKLHLAQITEKLEGGPH